EMSAPSETGQDEPPIHWVHAVPPALDTLCRTFGLSSFERDLLLLCAGPELDSRFAALCAELRGTQRGASPTFSLALSALPEAHWSALAPSGPLRHWRLVEIRDGETLAASPMRIDERILHYLAGVPTLDERLNGVLLPIPAPEDLPPSHREAAERMVSFWLAAGEGTGLPALQLCGDDRTGKRGVAAWACRSLGLRLHAMSHTDIPANVSDRESLGRLVDRESALLGSALLVEAEEAEGHEAGRTILPFLEQTRSVTVLSTRDPIRGGARTMVKIELPKPTRDEQRRIWGSVLGPFEAQLDGAIDGVVAQFDLGTRGIEGVGAQVMGRLHPGDVASGLGPREARDILWDACRAQVRVRLDDLAQRIQPDATWEDLVLPGPQIQMLRQIAAHVRHRTQVYERWGFARKSARGLGISALFAGPSGTGKTMASEVLANELRLDLYRIDLSQVVSKYIGETEKNLRRVFDAAEEGGSILLFDEADALFGKRSEVKDSHDRYANIEVSYLLQRMESYRGLAILTTNMKSALDTAFLRRLRFVVGFPFPDAAQRAEIWRRVFPSDTPVDAVDDQRLARLNVSGGNIRNIALGAAFMAADEGLPVRMTHLLRAARIEYAKLEKPLTDAEVGGWT
ncbi:MAG TPA: ATP-binding protein, partial [Actinomycetota bacterium]|nr:ATP-binding protein [Actinomycetota bacterium]